MDWLLRNPQIHSTFGSLGFSNGDGYHINENCNAALETILHNILTEDKYLRSYRRSISFGQNIDKDLIPLLIHTKEDKTIELLIRVLVNLSIPIECLLSVDVISKTDFGRHTIFEINNLLTAIKAAFTDQRATKVVVDLLKKNLDNEQKGKLSAEQCTNISNGLLLLRNILHIPEDSSNLGTGYSNCSSHTVQNQILWNIFGQSIDKILIKLMSIPEASNWGVTMVQLVALLYKDQHVVTLHKLLNLWLEASFSESSEDNESNTSPPDRGSEDSSPMLTSDPTSDSSDTGGSGKSNDEPNSVNNGWDATSMNNVSENGNQFHPPELMEEQHVIVEQNCDAIENTNEATIKPDNDKDTHSGMQTEQGIIHKIEKKTVISENSDCGYGTQIENQESISTSSNEDELPTKKPVHQKPHNPKQRVNTKIRVIISSQDRKRKKIVKRGKCNIINVQGLSHKTPTDDDISNILKEFTVDFLLKGYNSLVQTLHNQILTNLQLEIDTSHFFWLVTYFLKFATQIELDLEHVCSVLSYDIISYLTAEGVNLCEQFELAIKLDGNDLKPSIRRLHLVVTAIREFVQAIEVYKKFSNIDGEDQEVLVLLQMKMCETEELRSLLVLLLRHYNPKYHSKQYLQDLIVTNHILLIFLDSVMKLPDYNGSTNMTDHIKQFATPEIMYQYGLLLEDYTANGEFVNDCVFTLMHHVGGELGRLISLFQPKILKTFTSIWKSEFEICDDWSDLIEYVINTFIKKPHTLQKPANVWLENESFDDIAAPKPIVAPPATIAEPDNDAEVKKESIVPDNSDSNSTKDRWTEDELSSLSWNYMQCSASPDVVGEIIKLFKEDGINKTRNSVIRELYKQKLINKDEYESASKGESEKNSKNAQAAKEMRDDEIGKLCEQLAQDGKSQFLEWVQKVLLETCYAKITLEKKSLEALNTPPPNTQSKILNFDFFKKKDYDLPVTSPTSYHSLMYMQSVPLVPWNCEQAGICKDLKFLQLLHKLGFHMPVDTGRVFIRIPHFWTADLLYEVAGKVAKIDTTKLKFSLNDVSQSSVTNIIQQESFILSEKDITMIPATDNFYQVHKQKHFATMVNFTPMPGNTYDNVDDTKQNWLELVQKSQECKLTLNLRRSPVEKDNEDQADVEMVQPEELEVPSSSVAAPALVKVSVSAPQEMPAIVAASRDPSQGASHGASPYNVITESEFYNSLCETASVASDLTRMYVSDEDEKPEALLIKPIKSIQPIDEIQPMEGTLDSDTSTAEKRARVL
ncbi:protein timeless [Pectinophora gossypiella]|nr:protein timeless [Pectinophora gossypiella]XP_049865871.1 protein timeless [Pectinophora gossypiella]